MRIGRSAWIIGIVITHIFLCLFFFFNKDGLFTTTFLGKFYQSKVVIGPFFMEDRIRSAPHVSIQYHSMTDGWSDKKDLASNYRHAYDDAHWRYSALLKSDYLLYLCRNIGQDIKADSTRQINWDNRHFRALHQFIKAEGLIANQIDSVRFMYYLKIYQPEERISKSDTLWKFKYDVKTMEDILSE